MTPDELRRSLERADRQRRKLRRATLELRAMGESVLRARRDGPHRPDSIEAKKKLKPLAAAVG
jgi:hypothetical protein